jgi:hypothetical protein
MMQPQISSALSFAVVVVMAVLLAALAMKVCKALHHDGLQNNLVFLSEYHPVREETSRHERLYRLLDAIGGSLSRRGIPYWAMGGTVLGAVRHQGMVPWDDDIDLSIWSHDLGRAREAIVEDLGDRVAWGSEHRSFTVSEISRSDITIDIFPADSMEFRGQKVVHFTNPHARKKWEREYMTPEEFGVLKHVPFGPTSVPVAAAPCSYLDRVYPGWDTTGRIVRHHQLHDKVREPGHSGKTIVDKKTIVLFDAGLSRAYCEPSEAEKITELLEENGKNGKNGTGFSGPDANPY